MGEAKPWQIAVVVVGVLTLVGMVLWSVTRDTVELASKMTLVDVESGMLIEAKLPSQKAVIFPAINPETNRKTLYPAKQNESGEWELIHRYLPYIKTKDVDPKAVNLQTGMITVSSGPVSKSVFK